MILRLVWYPISYAGYSNREVATQLKRSTGWVERRLEELSLELDALHHDRADEIQAWRTLGADKADAA